MSFSFRHLDLAHPKFGLDRCPADYLPVLLERLSHLSGWTMGEFRLNDSRTIRSHRIEFSQTSEPDGFPLPEEETGTPWQFSLRTNAYGRVHGHLIGDVFYVVWVDAAHALYPGR